MSSFNWPPQGGGAGTVVSVGLSLPSSVFTVTGSPVTNTGTLVGSFNTQAANKVFAGAASGGVADPGFRALVAADLPDLSGTYVTQAEVGQPNGVAPLGASGKIDVGYLPADVFIYQGAWNPNTNTPTLADGTGTAGFVYVISAAYAGTIAGLNSPTMTNFQVGNLVIYNGSEWEQVAAAAGVVSVNGAQGVVTVNAINTLTGDVTASTASGSQSKVTSLVATSNATLVTLSALTTATALTSVGTIGTGAWQGTAVAIAYGGTGQATAAAAFNALSPLTTKGDILGYGTGNARLGVGTNGQCVVADSSQTLGIKWGSPAGTFAYLSSNTSAYGGTNSTLSFTGADCLVSGVGAGAALTSGTDNTLLGYNAGTAATTTSQNVAVGSGTVVAGGSTIAIGYKASAKANSVVLGYFASGSPTGSDVVLGYSATSSTGFNVSLGDGANAAGYAVSLGYGAYGSSTQSILIGADAADAGHAYTIAIGQAKPAHASCLCLGQTVGGGSAPLAVTTTTATNQITFGTNGGNAIALTDMFIGRGAVGDGTASNVSIQPSPIVAGTSNTAGASLTLRGGNSTGTGAGGSIVFQTAPAGSSGTGANTETTVGQVTSAGAWTLGATSATPQHVINTATGSPVSGTSPTGYIEITVNGTTQYIPYFT